MEPTHVPAVELHSTEALRDATDEDYLVHAWRAEQLRALGVGAPAADRFADEVDWREVAALVARGCPPELALEIVR